MASTSQESQQSGQITIPDPLPLSFLQEITKDFSSEELGHSVFGTIYKGTLPNNGGFVSVKKLAENAPVAQSKTFDAETKILKEVKHENIVQLLGSCQDTRNLTIQHNGRYVNTEQTLSFLCYEYLENGSLDKYIYETDKIDWDKRFKIVKGICQGLDVLHNKLSTGSLVHMNLVPSNIWLNDNWEPKIADFGLSRLLGQHQTHVNTGTVKGHYGYMAPEYLYRGEISTQADIYSLGMLIIEIATGQKINADDTDKAARNFVEKVRQDWKTDDEIKSKCPSLDTKRLQQVKTCIAIGLKCVDPERKKRPSIAQIIEKLEGKRVSFFDEISRLESA